MLIISTFAVVAHGILVYELTVSESYIVEEEAPENKDISKDSKEYKEDKISQLAGFYKYTRSVSLNQQDAQLYITYPKGYFNTPYNPPEEI